MCIRDCLFIESAYSGNSILAAQSSSEPHAPALSEVVTHDREGYSQMRLSNARNFLLLAPALLVGGCTLAPSFVLFGAAFPSWMFCIIGGVVATVVVHVALGCLGKRSWLAPAPAAYPALAATISLAGWLAFFSH